ncbi:MAG: aminotransferase class I/II-fold pyridoxal phosphate-dependent enzyme [Pseudomonadota bacterium]
MNYQNYFQKKLLNLKAKNLYRAPKINNGKLLNFCSNDYLGLAENKVVKNAAIKAIEKFGVGAKASRYVFSDNNLAEKLENKLAELKKCDAAITLGSGYLSGVGVIPALVGEGDLIIADKLIHSSLIDGCKLSGAKLLRFKHNDLEHCQIILEKSSLRGGKADAAIQKDQKILIITETVFSMDGNLGRVDELLELAKKYNCLILSDDAHGLGIIKTKYPKYDFHLQSGTLSKAAGGYGGYVCGSALMIDYLRNFTKSAIYSTALPAAVLAANLKAIEIITKDKKLGKKALENARYFCDLIGLKKPQSTIVPIIIGDTSKTLELSQKLKQNGFLISAIRPPTVENNKSRLRITFCANHKKSDIKKLAKLILKYCYGI